MDSRATEIDPRDVDAPSIDPEGVDPRDVVMIIRHAEKPTETEQGVRFEGRPDKKSLTAAGWARAGALVELFAPAVGPVRAGLFRPRALFAYNRNGPGGGSNRGRETLRILAARLGIEVNVEYGVGEEQALMAAVAATEGPSLICWKHDYMSVLANHLGEVQPAVPADWPLDRYDVVWVFTRSSAQSGAPSAAAQPMTRPAAQPDPPAYQFTQVPELLLPGDSVTPLV